MQYSKHKSKFVTDTFVNNIKKKHEVPFVFGKKL